MSDLCVPELTGALRVTFVRSPLAHALVTGIDVSAARDQPGVVAVLTAKGRKLPNRPAPRCGAGGSNRRRAGQCDFILWHRASSFYAAFIAGSPDWSARGGSPTRPP